jgi:hypothetical protein
VLKLLIYVCLAAFVCLLWLLRRDRVSLGLPLAYLYSLLLIHVPGAFAHVVGGDFLLNSDLVESAMRFTALGSTCFVLGVWWARSWSTQVSIRRGHDCRRFWLFCLIGGWSCIYGLSPFYNIPSFNAVGEKGGAIWMLGVLLGLRNAIQRGDRKWILFWISALMVFPVVMLLFGGFLSYGSAAIILVCSALTVSTRSYWRVVAGIAVFTFVSMSIFVNYFQHRTEIRNQVWGGAPLDKRIDSVVDTFSNFELFDTLDSRHLTALDQRLNQNYYVGLAARRIERGQAEYLRGESFWEGLLALVPRVFWPDKPVYGGSPEIVSKMTGLRVSRDTSFGVGNVMEFQINFGVPGVVVGFLLLGWAIGKLDFKAAIAERQGELGNAILFFLPCVAMIQPNGSIVEITGGSAAALVAAYGWSLFWTRRIERHPASENGPSYSALAAHSNTRAV